MRRNDVRNSALKSLLAAACLFTATTALAAGGGHTLCNGFPNGILDGKEECETGPCCTVRCELEPAGTLCRAAGADPVCDPAEFCEGVTPVANAACPADVDPPTTCDDGLFCTDDD